MATILFNSASLRKVRCFYFFLIALVPLFSVGSVACAESQKGTVEELRLKFTKDVRITLFADGVPNARRMAFDDQGILFLSQHRTGKVVALPDKNGDGKSDRKVTLLKNRQVPHGLAFVQLDSGYYLCGRGTASHPHEA